MKEITVSAKTLDDAITEASIQLGVSSDQMEYDVIEKGSTGFFGIGSKQAVIKARLKKEKAEQEETISVSEIFESKPEVKEEQKSEVKNEVKNEIRMTSRKKTVKISKKIPRKRIIRITKKNIKKIQKKSTRKILRKSIRKKQQLLFRKRRKKYRSRSAKKSKLQWLQKKPKRSVKISCVMY